MSIPGFIIIACWAVFLLYWLVSAFAVKATAERKGFASSVPYRILVILGAFFLARPRQPDPFNIQLTPYAPCTPWIGAALCIIGLAVALWSRWTLAGNWSSDVQFKQGHKLIQNGPYRFVRHPIYTGILLMCLAPAIQFGRLHSWLGVSLMAVGFWIKLKQEEKVMMQHFPEYAEYRKRVKAIVPFVL
jgi:protein-S-isoprenylcysteine O-methyltransferase Ste14